MLDRQEGPPPPPPPGLPGEGQEPRPRGHGGAHPKDCGGFGGLRCSGPDWCMGSRCWMGPPRGRGGLCLGTCGELGLGGAAVTPTPPPPQPCSSPRGPRLVCAPLAVARRPPPAPHPSSRSLWPLSPLPGPSRRSCGQGPRGGSRLPRPLAGAKWGWGGGGHRCFGAAGARRLQGLPVRQ